MIEDLIGLLAESGQPNFFYDALDAALARHVGHRLLTLLYTDGDEVARVYSNMPDVYPVFGRKPMGMTPWGELVLRRQQPFLGRDREAVRWAFFDHELIASLGLNSAINIPVVYNGETIGTINLLHEEFFYEEKHVEIARQFAPLLIPAFLEARRAGTSKA
ncbi:GAF domain-containing protein [Neorhizobium galegae]|uniref:GAF domain protein n=1 Tax=Neorhizobium galegae bv. orientalis str. HAMBI 540 TaxID=1028800 RepID=A0A068SZS1_NEOGA|nr:GAF domain-containing protein [Neorhizobium galegae]MCQ1853486.1 GAF domain-containing protein [Neorhizobium galegae]CDN51329.1 GAF domain protein [Neorhizobium galegae bv. orientalis str. HAMBI 540]